MLGLFAARQFLIDWILTVYFGERPQEAATDETRRLQVAPGKFIDVLADKLGNRPLYSCAHFINTPYIDCTLAEDYAKYDKKIGWGRMQTAK